MITRIPILDVQPQIEGGRFPVKAAVGESFLIRARIFREGPDQLGAAVVLTGPDGVDRPPVTMHHLDNDFWGATLEADAVGTWRYRIESWSDPYATWLHDAPIKIEAGVDVELMLEEGARLLERSGVSDRALDSELALVRDQEAPELERLAAGMSFAPVIAENPIRDFVDYSQSYPLQVDRERALFGSWYELFPRSEGAYRESDGTVVSGTFVTAAKRLEAVADMGFDVVYLPPIHPIGKINRKGPNNSLTCGPDDPGSPWAIGSAEGGHDAVNPALGTIDDFDAFVVKAHELGLEIALDFALQCAPDHPWAMEHPEWFTTRADGTIAFAENPPKKYQDIYPLNFDNDFDGLCAEVIRVLRFWMSHGVRIFRVDNPHTKPVSAWERILADIRETDPDVIFLSEAFTVPAMLHALAMVGFHQSYTYFTWREHKIETGAYLEEVAAMTSHFMRPNFFVNTPDILPAYLNSGDPAMFKIRAVLAATGSPTWGMYAGFELCEHDPIKPGSEDYLNSEKYEIKIRNWNQPGSLAPYITRLNELRRSHPALRQLRNLHVHTTDDADVLCFSKQHGNDRILVVVDLLPSAHKQVRLTLNLPDLGLRWGDPFLLQDELTGQAATPNSVNISPDHPARIFNIVRP